MIYKTSKSFGLLIMISSLFGNFLLNEKVSSSRKIDFNLSEIQLVEKDGHVRIKADKSGFTNDEGMPELPTYSITYHVDPFVDYEIEMNIISSHFEENIDLYPSQNQINNVKNKSFLKNLDFYNSENKYPLNNIQVSNRQIMRGEEFITITITPFNYYPSTRILEVIDEIEIDIIENGIIENNNYKQMPRSRVFEKFMTKFSPNYVMRNNEKFQPPSILYICGGASSNDQTFQELLDWRHQRGYVVYTVDVNDIGNNSDDIKDYIDNAYYNWEIPPEFVTIVGDASGSYSVDTNYEYYSGVQGEGDWPYSLVAGNDFMPEVIIGRLSVRNPTHIGVVVNKILNYEKASDMDDGWYETASLVSDPYDSGISTVITNEYIQQLMDEYGTENIQTKYNGNSYSNWIENQFNNGTLYVNYRGYYGASGFDPDAIMEDLYNYSKHPFATFLTCDTGSFDSGTYCLSETLLRSGTPNAPVGAIAAVGTATIYTHTAFNNIINMGIYEGIFIEENYTAGEAVAYGKLVLNNIYPSNPSNNVNLFSYWNNLMGDASTHLWTKRPQLITVNHVSTIQPGSNFVNVEVLNENGLGINEAYVTLLKGNDEIFVSAYTNSSGIATLEFDDTSSGEILVTVVKQDHKPSQSTISISNNDVVISLPSSEISILDDEGNGDGIINAGETFDMQFRLSNSGSSSVSNLNVNLVSNSQHVNILSESVNVGNLDSNSNSDLITFSVQLNEDMLDATDLELRLNLNSEGNNWDIIVPASVSGAKMDLSNILILEDDNLNGVLEPGESCQVFISLYNQGTTQINDLIGTLSTSMPGLQINGNTSSWNTIDPNQDGLSLNSFVITSNSSIINGSVANFEIILNNDQGYNQKVNFSIQLGTVSVTDPLGPDQHGYYIYDHYDTDYDLAPTYNWIEIDPGYGGDGFDVGLNDNGNGEYSNSISTVSLPFPFTFYGIEYDEITICSNGWITFGETNMESFRNYELPGAGGPSPMIAVFWDDLKTTSGGDVFAYSSPDNDYYIIEWSDMRTFNSNSIESFQLILYNTSDQTPTGDDEMLMQYKEFNNTSTGSYPVGNWDAVIHGAYCSIGLENHDGTIGIEYTFNNQYPTAARTLNDYSALFITTKTPLIENEYVLGDINMDELVNILDIVLVVQHILEEIIIDPSNIYLADMNQDGLVNILDIVAIVSIILE